MNVQEIMEHVREAPFVPFRLHLWHGVTFDIPHPDFLSVSRTAVHVSTEVGEDHIPEKIVRVSLLHITHWEPMPGLAVR